MGTADWYQRKLGTPAPAQPAPSSYPAMPPMPGRAAPEPQHYQQPQQFQPQQGSAEAPSEEMVVTVGNFMEAAARWKGGAGNKEKGRCPKCGGNNYFSRVAQSIVTQRGRAAPAPICYECGYNGMWEQFGTTGDGE